MNATRRSTLYGLLGLALFLALWQTIGVTHAAGPSVPSLTQVAAIYATPWRRALLFRAAASTLLSAAIGLIAGSIFGVATAFLAHLAPPLRTGLDRLSVLVNAVPAIALGPILIVTVGRDFTPATLAAIPVFFLLYLTVSTGLRSVSPRLHDLLAILGANRLTRLYRLEAPAAIPAFLGGLRIAVTAAVVGAIVGEWFGAATGLGIVILNTMLNFQIPMMWAAVLLAATTSLTAYTLLGFCERYAQRRFT